MPKQIVKVIDNKKPCSVCKQLLDISNFRKNDSLVCKLHPQCRKCELKGRIKHRKKILTGGISVQKAESLQQCFKLSLDTYLEMLKVQNNKCDICKGNETNVFKNKVRSLSVDHCHKTGKIRALLCSNCNHGIGCFQDNIELLKEAINYLEKHKN